MNALRIALGARLRQGILLDLALPVGCVAFGTISRCSCGLAVLSPVGLRRGFGGCWTCARSAGVLN